MKRLLLLLVLTSFSAFADDVLRLDYERQSLTATYRHYTQIIDGLEVAGSGVIERVDRDGSVHELHRALAHRPAIVRRRMTANEAMTELPPGHVRDSRLAAVNVNGEARTAWRVVVEESVHQPVAHYVDASTGAILRSEPLFFRVQARVFDINPVSKLNRPDLTDANNAAAAVPLEAYTLVELDNLDAGGPLTGPYVMIRDLDSPTTPAADASQSLLFDRSQPQFEDVNTYFLIDRTQRYINSLGYSGSRRVVAYPLPVDPHAVSGSDDSFFLRGAIPGQGTLLLGEGGTDDAEDADIVLHEFGHAIQEWIAPGTFTGSPSANPPALGEGFADYWAFSSSYAATMAAGRDPFCIGDWDARCAGDDPAQRCSYPAGADCLRRVDSTKTMADYINANSGGAEHKNGEIWSSALREIFLKIGKQAADTTIIEGTFGVPPNPTFGVMARQLLDADAVLNHGANAAVICSAMTTRGILQAADCNSAPRGERTIIPGGDHGVAIPDNTSNGLTLTTTVTDSRSIDKLFVNVDVAHTARGDLQIVLVGPDGTNATLLRPSLDRTANVQVTYGLDAQPADSLEVFHGHPAAGEWKLIVQDLRPKDSGTLRSWSLVIKFVGDEALTTRPASFAPRWFIPAVAHAPGANGTNFATDVRIFNRSAATQTATLVFTPTGQDGWTHFAAVKVQLRAGETIALDDVVARTMQSTGGGNLDVVGDSSALIVTSRTFTTSGSGTYGQSIPSGLTSDALALGDARQLVPLVRSSEFRTNYGFSEVAGGSGRVRFTFFDAAGDTLATREYDALPFLHFQTLADIDGVARAEARVVSGDARVLVYASVVDNRSGDPTYIEGQTPLAAPAEFGVPVIHADGVNGTAWRTDLTLAGVAQSALSLNVEGVAVEVSLAPGKQLTLPDVVSRPFFQSGTKLLVVRLREGAIADATRTWTDSDRGSYGVSIPLMARAAARPPGAPPMHVIHLESSPAFRTNIGIVGLDDDATRARLIVYDGAGRELARRDVDVPARSAVQLSLRSLISSDVYDARITVENVGESGRIFAYGSINDNTSGDPIYIGAQ